MSTAIAFIVVFNTKEFCVHTWVLSLCAFLKLELHRQSASRTSCNNLRDNSPPGIITSCSKPKKLNPGNRNLLLLRLFRMFLTRCTLHSVIKKVHLLSLVIGALAFHFIKIFSLQFPVCQNICCVVIPDHSSNLPKNKKCMWRIIISNNCCIRIHQNFWAQKITSFT